MVRGVTRQIILVDPEDKTLFEKAIFILRDNTRPDSPEELLEQAKNIAAGCVTTRSTGRSRLRCLLWAAAGAALTGCVWLFCELFR